jgi:hypothetical protein
MSTSVCEMVGMLVCLEWIMSGEIHSVGLNGCSDYKFTTLHQQKAQSFLRYTYYDITINTFFF